LSFSIQSYSLLCYATRGKNKTKQKKKVTAAAVAFFVKLRYSVASKEEEEGNSMCCNAVPQ
jgi:hypothetical protein